MNRTQSIAWRQFPNIMIWNSSDLFVELRADGSVIAALL